MFKNKIVKFPIKDLSGKVCTEPFNTINVTTSGDVFLCPCEGWHPTVVGNLFENNIQEILSSDLAQDIRNSIRKGTYEYCNESQCGIMANNQLLDSTSLMNEDKERFEDSDSYFHPRYVYLAGDQTCNLSCPSCRKKVINLDDNTLVKNKSVMSMVSEQVFNDQSDQPVVVHISSAGEVFASQQMMLFLENFPLDRYPKLVLNLQTNGLLLKNRWHRIQHLADNLRRISITADSQDPITYEKLRRGGTLKKLEENLEFVKELHEKYKFIYYSIRMVVQKDNANELEDFYHWATSYGCTHVDYLRISNWGTYSNKEFSSIDVLNPKHELYNDTVNRLRQLKTKYKNVLFFNFNI